jgi:O-antigen/teichoic acid export membrane protein
MTWTRQKALKDITILTLSQYTVQALVVLRGFLFGKYLGPEGFGVWASIYLFYTYGQYAHLGIFNGAVILVPEKIGAGNIKEANNYLSSAITWMNIFGLLFFIATTFFVFLSGSPFISTYWLPIMFVSFAVPLYFNFNFSVYRLQFKHDFKKSGVYQALLAVFDLGISFVLMLKYGIKGAYAGLALSLFIFNLSILKGGYKDLFISLNRETFSVLFKLGSKLLLIIFGFGFLTTADKFFVASFLSKTEMGIFSMAISFAMVPYTIGSALQGVNLQRMLEEFGKTKDKFSLKIFLDESILATAFLVPLFAILLIAFAEPLITLLLPKYIGSLAFVDKLSVGVYFLAIGLCCWSFFIVIKKYILIVTLQIILISFGIISNYFITKSGFGLLGVSCITVLNYYCFAFILYLFSYKIFYDTKRILWMFIRLSLPALPIVIAFSIKYFISNPIFCFGTRILIVLLWSAFAYYYLMKKTTILSQLIVMIKNKFSN